MTGGHASDLWPNTVISSNPMLGGMPPVLQPGSTRLKVFDSPVKPLLRRPGAFAVPFSTSRWTTAAAPGLNWARSPLMYPTILNSTCCQTADKFKISSEIETPLMLPLERVIVTESCPPGTASPRIINWPSEVTGCAASNGVVGESKTQSPLDCHQEIPAGIPGNCGTEP